MKARVEILSGIVRVGPDHEKYGDPYDGAVAFSSADGRHAVVKALNSEGLVTLSRTKAVIKALKDVGLIPIWERIK